jgi:hypothetical protein
MISEQVTTPQQLCNKVNVSVILKEAIVVKLNGNVEMKLENKNTTNG